MLNFLKRIFNKSKDEQNFAQNKNNIFKNQVEDALKKCKEDQKQQINDIDKIKKWAKDIIFEIFNVPNEFWYEELNKYEIIKSHKSNLSVSKQLLNKTDSLIKEYREQIQLYESKITFCNTLINEYENIINRYEETEKKLKKIKEEEQKLKLLKKHKTKIENLRSKNENFENIYSNTGIISNLHEDINNIEDDFKIKQEVNEYIENLDNNFNSNTDNLTLREEIIKLTSEIKTK